MVSPNKDAFISSIFIHAYAIYLLIVQAFFIVLAFFTFLFIPHLPRFLFDIIYFDTIYIVVKYA